MQVIDFFKKKWNVVLYFVAIFAIGVCVQIRTNTNIDDTYKIKDFTDISSGWEYEFGDGIKGTTSLPANLPETSSDILILSNILPEIDYEDSFFYRSRHTALQIYVGDELRVDTMSQMTERDLWYQFPGVNYVEVDLTPEDSNKEITIITKTVLKRYVSGPGAVYLTDRGSLFLMVLRNHIHTVICSALMLFFAVVLLGLWMSYTIILKQKCREILCLGLFSLSVAVWTATESDCGQFFMSDTGIVGLIAYETVMLLPVPIALYFFYYSDREKMRIASKVAATVPLFVFFINNTLHYTRIKPLSETLPFSQLILGLELIFIAYIQITEIYYKYRIKEGYNAIVWKIPLAGILILVPLAGLEIFKYAFSPTKYANNGILISVGVFFYLCSLACDSIVRTSYRTETFKKNSEVKSQFLANMSHEIRTPLNAIIGFNEVVLRTTKDEKVKKYALDIQDASENLKSIINSILDISKIESGKLEIYEVEYSTMQSIDHVVSLFETMAQKKDLQFVSEIDSRIPEVLIGDENHVAQVISNLLSNAIKYTEAGTVTFSVELLELSKETPTCTLRISVKDTGIGIKEEDMSKLFEKFERLDRNKNYNTEGTGLGMNIVVQLLKAMNSEIHVESVYGEGSTFYFDIVQSVVDYKEIGSFIEKRKQIAFANNNVIDFTAPDASILIVDDVQLNLDAACALLEDLKMTMDTAHSGLEAVEKVKNNHYDLILMDHMMPEMDGVQATEAIRNYAVEAQDVYFAEVPIIALTANAVVGMKEYFFSIGMQDFVSKPIDIKVLISAIKRWLPKEKMVPLTEEMIEKSASKASVAEETWDSLPDFFNKEMAKQYCTKYDLFIRNIRNYSESFAGTKEKLLGFKEKADGENYCISVHGLKSTSKMIGLEKVFESAYEHEMKCKDEQLDWVWANVSDLLEKYGEAVGVINEFLGISQDAEPATVDAMTEADYLQLKKEIFTAADGFDMDALMNFEDKLMELVPPAGCEEEFARIRKLVGDASFGDLAEMLGE